MRLDATKAKKLNNWLNPKMRSDQFEIKKLDNYSSDKNDKFA